MSSESYPVDKRRKVSKARKGKEELPSPIELPTLPEAVPEMADYSTPNVEVKPATTPDALMMTPNLLLAGPYITTSVFAYPPNANPLKRSYSDDDEPANQAFTPAALALLQQAGTEKHNGRFEPTHAETEYLERLFLQNDQPSIEVRRAAADILGVDIKKVTTWFSNRKSKRREVIGITGYTPPIENDIHANMSRMYNLLCDEDPDLTILPSYIFRLGSWTRALALDHPSHIDYCLATRENPPQLIVVTVHQHNAYRVTIPIHPEALSRVGDYTSSSRQRNPGELALRAEFQPRTARYARYNKSTETWEATGDFTGGANNKSTAIEILGWQEDVRMAGNKIRSLLARETLRRNAMLQAHESASVSGGDSALSASPERARTATVLDDAQFAFVRPGTTGTTASDGLSRDPTPLITPGTTPTTALGSVGSALGTQLAVSDYEFAYGPHNW